MKGAFVIRLGLDSKPLENRFEGWVEEVDSGTESRFHTTEDLLRFLGERFHVVFGLPPEVENDPSALREEGEP